MIGALFSFQDDIFSGAMLSFREKKTYSIICGSKKASWDKNLNLKPNLVGGFNPCEKYESKWAHLPQGSGWKFNKIFETTT